MFSGLIDLALHRRHPAMKWYTGTAVMLVGVAVLAAAGANDSSVISLSLFGMLSAMAAGLGYAVYAHTTSVLISRRCRARLARRHSVVTLLLLLLSAPLGYRSSCGASTPGSIDHLRWRRVR